MNGTRVRTRAALYDAALDLFARYGYQATSHADIAAAAGIARTTFYEYFPSTEELLVELVEERLPEVLEGLVAEVPGADPERRLAGLVARMIEFIGTDHLGLILHSEVPRLSPGAQRRIATAHEELSTAFTEVYRDGVAQGRFHQHPGRLADRLMLAVIMAAGREVMDAGDPEAEVAAIRDRAVAFLLEGLAIR
ncbi:MAG: TetR family transcriptional regulator [Acidimicrobiia bacterium]|jgi:AcrR family transcriptional regulator